MEDQKSRQAIREWIARTYIATQRADREERADADYVRLPVPEVTDWKDRNQRIKWRRARTHNRTAERLLDQAYERYMKEVHHL